MKEFGRPTTFFLILLLGLSLIEGGCGDEGDSSGSAEIVVTQHSVETQDHVEIALFHYRLSGSRAGGKPVLLCPGIVENHYGFDVAAGASLSRFLASRGIDVWALDFRGRGASGSPAGTTGLVAPWSVDDFAYFDIRAAADYVAGESATGQIFLLGFSEGGAATVAYLTRVDPGRVCGYVAMSPAIMLGASVQHPEEHLPPIQQLLSLLSPFDAILPSDLRVPVPGIVQPVYRTIQDRGKEEEFLQMSFWNLIWNMDNMDEALVEAAIFTILAPISGNEAKQYLRGADPFHRTGVCTFEGSALEKEVGPFCYMDELSKIRVPAFVLVGGVDPLVPAVITREFFDGLGSEDKEFRVFGLAEGDHSDYGHNDLSFGVHAAEDVFPAVASWLLGRM